MVLESGSFDALVERVRYAVLELLSLNAAAQTPIRLHLHSDRRVSL
ncbi:MAG: DUF1902 domain-containing protein [Oscillospiraceae bacterium]|nr:DUF1902 domain-containing protein [Oscillospiraceae bacterium]